MKNILLFALLFIYAIQANSQSFAFDKSFNVVDTIANRGLLFNNGVSAICKTPSDKILVGGLFTLFNDMPASRILQLDEHGEVDYSFKALPFNGEVSAFATQPDGKILIGGNFTSYAGQHNRIVRINADGLIDTSFHAGLGANASVTKLLVLNNGKILICGNFTSINGINRNRIARLNATGSVDTTFNPGTGANAIISDMAITNDGEILAGGLFTTFNGVNLSYIARLNNDGSIDNRFSPSIGPNNQVRAILPLPDGRIIIGGSFTTYNTFTANRLVCINPNGSLNNLIPAANGTNGAIHTIKQLPDGKLLLGGEFNRVNGITKNRIARILLDGSIDTTFNMEGGFDPDNLQEVQVKAIITHNNKLIVGGTFRFYKSTQRQRIAFLEYNGDIDQSFQSFTGFPITTHAVKAQKDGKILVGGDFITYNNITSNRLIRINKDGTIDTTFKIGTGFNTSVSDIIITDSNQIFVVTNFSNNLSIAKLDSNGIRDNNFKPLVTNINGNRTTYAVQKDGKVLVGGHFTVYNGFSRNRVVRLNQDGLVDTSFVLLNGADNSVNKIVVQPNGKILIGGTFATFNAERFNKIVRLNEDGTLDTTFKYTNHIQFNVLDISLQPDDKILLTTSDLRMIRLNEDGTRDSTFKFNPFGNTNNIRKFSALADGKILIVGSFTSLYGVAVNRIALLNNDGSLVNKYDTYKGANNTITSFDIDNDGNIMIVGNFSRVNNFAKNRIARLIFCKEEKYIEKIITCNTYTWPKDNNTYGLSGNYYKVYENMAGCDSVYMLDLTIGTQLINQNVFSCNSYIWNINNIQYNESGMYSEKFTNQYGCDSIYVLNLTIQKINKEVSRHVILPNQLIATQSNAQYQWVDCNKNYAFILGATNKNFTPSAIPGNYAVIISMNNCTDTSDCIGVWPVGLNDTRNNAFSIYPNPANTLLHINMSKPLPLEIYALDGKLLENHGQSNQFNIDVSNYLPGIYILKTPEGVARFIKQ